MTKLGSSSFQAGLIQIEKGYENFYIGNQGPTN